MAIKGTAFSRVCSMPTKRSLLASLLIVLSAKGGTSSSSAATSFSSSNTSSARAGILREWGGYSTQWWQALSLVRKRSSASIARPFVVTVDGGDGSNKDQGMSEGSGGGGAKRVPAFKACPWLVVEEPKTGEIWDPSASVLRYSSGVQIVCAASMLVVVYVYACEKCNQASCQQGGNIG